MTKLAIIFGTRPEAIKLGPVVAELRELGVEPCVFATGQHEDLLLGTPAETDLASATFLLQPSNDRPLVWASGLAPMLRHALARARITHVVVQGDTATALAGARAALLLGLPLAHVEAGVRSHTPDEPWPEEIARVEIDALAQLHLAATSVHIANLANEGRAATARGPTGNSGISALARYAQVAPSVPMWPPTVLITLHRRELRLRKDAGAVLDALYNAVVDFPATRFLWPTHPGMRAVMLARRPPDNLELVPPLPYRECAERLATCVGVLTDSGGLVEEATALGVPVAILRRVNDRPEAEAWGIAARFDPAPADVHEAVQMLVQQELPRLPSDVYGTPQSAARIAALLADWLKTS